MALFGPTGMGKTEIAIALAELLDGEIVSADSMQVYRGLPIVTNQPSAEQLARVPHHLVAVIDPGEEFSVALYADLAQAAVDDIRGRGRAALVVGGSGLYLRAALGGLSFAGKPCRPTAGASRRWRAPIPRPCASDFVTPTRRRSRPSTTAIHGGSCGPSNGSTPGAGRAPAGPRRALVRRGLRHPSRLFCLDVDRERLRQSVEARVDEMFDRGLVSEVAALPRSRSRTVAQAIGVREIMAVLAGDLTPDEARIRMKARTRGYVRRQLTWMRKLNADIIPTSAHPPESVAREIAQRLQRLT